eukprot:5499836-Pyramimonas_sp.AAC.1
MSQNAKGICFPINEETLAFAVQSLAKVYLAICGECSEWTPPDSMAETPAGVNAGTPAGEDDAADKFDIFHFEQWFSSAAWRGHLNAPIV